MSVENFKETMLKLRTHYATRPEARKHASVAELMGWPAESDMDSIGLETLPPDAEADIRTFHRILSSEYASDESKMTKAVQEYQSNHDFPSFRDSMDRLRDKQIAESTARLTEMFKELTESGEKHPDSQQAILTASKAIGKFVDELLTSISNFVHGLVSKIIEWVKVAVAKIKEWATDVANWISNFFRNFS